MFSRRYGRWQRGGGRPRIRGPRGVSDVVATILLLALTVVLFSSIFAFVNTFPAPPAQNTSQFSAALVLTPNQTSVQAIKITHLAGPAVPGTALVWFKSAAHPNAVEFQNPIVASTGLGGAVTWNLGQVFNYTFLAGQQPALPDNITVLVTTADQLIFSTILPGQLINVPPSFTSTGVIPANPQIGHSFTVYAVAAGNLGGASVYVNLANIPGLIGTYPHAVAMTYNAATNLWTFTVPANLTVINGTYYAFVNVTGALQQTATAGVAIPFVLGGSTSSLFSVAVVMVPQPPVLPATSSYFAAVVSYYGSSSNVPVAVTFFANQTPMSTPAGKWTMVSHQFNTASGLHISGPSTMTVYSSSPATFSAWLFNSTVSVVAVATLTGIGTAKGQTNYTSANLVQGITYSTIKSFSHSCTLAACPFLNLTVWNNWTTAIKFAGILYTNASASSSYTIASTTVNAGASVTQSPPGAKIRWHPAAGSYTLTLVLTITAGGITVGYVYDTVTGITVS